MSEENTKEKGSENKIIDHSKRPNTIASLAADFERLGVATGMTLLVHSSLSKLGWTVGGAQSVILALEQVLGASGTLVMPTHSADLTDPAAWENPPVPEAWWPIIREGMPPFRPDLTPTRGMGKIPEAFRAQVGVSRSYHPIGSFAAWGAQRDRITAAHPLSPMFGLESPLGRVVDLNGFVLLLGVGYGNCTLLHLSEVLADYPGKKMERVGTSVLRDGRGCWVEYDDVAYDEDDFEQIGAAFERVAAVKVGSVGKVSAEVSNARLIPARQLLTFAKNWLPENRKVTAGSIKS